MQKPFEITYFYGKVKKYRSTNNKREPLNFEEAKALYYKMLLAQKNLPQLYRGVDCNFKNLLEGPEDQDDFDGYDSYQDC